MLNIQAKVTIDLRRLHRMIATIRRGLAEAGNPIIDGMFRKWAVRYSAFVMRRFTEFSHGGGDWPPLKASTKYGRSRAPVRRLYAAYKAGDLSASDFHAKLKTTRSRMGITAKQVAIKVSAARSAYGRGQMSKAKLAKVIDRAQRAGVRRQKVMDVAERSAILVDTGTLKNSLTIGSPGNITQREKAVMRFGIGGGDSHPGSQLTIGRLAEYHQLGGSIPGRPPKREIIVMPPEQVVKGMEADAGVAVRQLCAAAEGGGR
jgi:hypothetical protein